MPEAPERLRALLAGHGLITGRDLQQRAETTGRLQAEGAFEIEKIIPGEVIGEGEDAFFRVRTEFPLDTVHGDTALGAVLGVTAGRIAFSACDDSLQDFDARTAVFVDTETTGLVGGTGTVAFLVGAAQVVGDRLVLDQCFLRDYPDEEPMLAYLRDAFRPTRTLVTYNGKSFDAPLLRSRFIQNRMASNIDGLAHLDLVHAARRFWRLRLQDCSLTQVERSILGVRRVGDIPSAEIPQIWLDYLRTRDARPLDRVFYHHRMDILSLVTLTARLAQTVGFAETSALDHSEDQLSFVRVCFRQKRYAEVLTHGRRLLERGPDEHLLAECLRMMGLAGKRTSDWSAMVDAWTHLLAVHPGSIDARIELAKHYEHRLRDLLRAEELCAEAVSLLQRRAALDRALASGSASLLTVQARLDRIRRKLEGGLRRGRDRDSETPGEENAEAESDADDETP